MFDPTRDDDELAGIEFDPRLVFDLDGEVSGDDEEEFVFVIVMVPHEVAEHFDELDVLSVEFADDLGGEVVGEAGEGVGNIELPQFGLPCHAASIVCCCWFFCSA